MGTIHSLRDRKSPVETLAAIRTQLNEIGIVTARTAEPILRATRVSAIMRNPSVKRLHFELDAGGTIHAPVHLCCGHLLYVVMRDLAKYVAYGDDVFGPFQKIEFYGRDDNVTIDVWQNGTRGSLLFDQGNRLRTVFCPASWHSN